MNKPQFRDGLHVVIGCDTDPDRTPETRKVSNPRALWQGVERGISALERALADAHLEEARITWLLRADFQMRECFGHYAFPAFQYRALWDRLRGKGDEIGWHPHLWAWNDRRSVWYPELRSEAFVDHLTEAHAALSEVFPVRSCRTGWGFCSSAFMRLLAKVGIEVEFSAMPGLRHVSFLPSGDFWCNDWSLSPNQMYFPAASNYQLPGQGADILPIVELPLTLLPMPLSRAVAKLPIQIMRRLRAGKSAADGIPHGFSFARFEMRTITGNPTLMLRAIDYSISSVLERGWGTFVTYFHPDELLEESSLRNFIANLRYLETNAKSRGIALYYTTAGSFARSASDSEDSSVSLTANARSAG